MAAAAPAGSKGSDQRGQRVEKQSSAASQEPARDDALLRVLIVEDEVFVAMDAEAILLGAGHHVVATAASADDAVAKAAQFAPNLVLMDIRLVGDRDGIEAALEIKARFSIPIIFVTANNDPITYARAKSAEPLTIVSKPFTPNSLLAAVALLKPLH
jgi:two-component system, response regulator PdtaR